MKNLFGFAVVLTALLVFGFGCKKAGDSAKIEIMAAGASFPYPLYDTMFKDYHKAKGVQINYQPTGSGSGIKGIADKMVHFGGTDAPMTEEDFKNAGAEVLHVPTALGAVVVVYNLEGNPELKFTSDVLADIFMGKIAKWNDEKIQSINPNVELPDIDITVVRRADKSGTTFIFSDYLSTVSAEFEKTVGRSSMPNWPQNSLGGKQNPGVTELVRRTNGAIGYVEIAYAIQQKLSYATIQNKSGNFIKPSIESVTLAADVEIPEHTRVSIVDTASAQGYPIAGFTWVLLYQEQKYNNKMTFEQAKAVVELIWWMVTEGQVHCAPLEYSPLPKAVQEKAHKLLKSVTFDGKPVLN